MVKQRKKPTPTTAAKPVRRQRNNKVPLQIRVAPELLERIERYAQAEDISVSAYCRRILINQVPGG
jgi:predicted HicB family RNase H-like nuclease